jgi:hypothetical protein
MRNWEIDMAKKEFLQSGMTILELLKKKGYTQWGIEGRMWIPPGGGEMSAIPKDEALQRILINWNN